MARVALLTVLALCGFAANSLLCRAALSDGGRWMDGASFTSVRLCSGALVLAALARLRPRPPPARAKGSWTSAFALFAYAAGFSLAYVRIPAGTGALILFGCVQLTMLGVGIARGERPGPLAWAGLAVALAGLVALNLPGVSAPDPLGAALMAAAGVAWGVYSLRGRGSSDPLAVTADNFLRSVPMTLALSAAALVGGRPHVTGPGLALAVASGAIASGVGYSLWYAALPSLTATRAGIVQLTVPVLTAAGAVLLLAEPLSLRVVLAGAALLVGVQLAMGVKARRVNR